MNIPIILKGNSKLLKPVITQIMAMHQLINNLEISTGNDDDKAFPNRRFHPQIRLHFLQDSDYKQTGTNPDTYQGKRRLEGRLSFRLMNETSESISKGELTRIGTSIKNIFGANNGYVWNKGKEMYCYADWDKGYQLQMLVRSNTQAKDLVTKILSLQNHNPEWIFLTKCENQSESERYPDTPQTKIILGEVVTLARTRPRAEVRFRYADARVHHLTEPVVLFDRTYRRLNPLVT